jgi:hypothetical protein
MTPDVAAQLLGVTPDASPAEIEAAYKRQARSTHPDRFAGEPGHAHAQDFIAVTTARDVLLGHAALPVVVVRGVRPRSPVLLGTWIALLLLSVFLLIYREPTPLTIAEPVLRLTVLCTALIGYALTGRRIWLVLTILGLVATAVMTLVSISIGGLLGMFVLMAPLAGLLLMGVEAAKRAVMRAPRAAPPSSSSAD